MSDGPKFPHPVSGKITDETKKQIKSAEDRFGVTEGALVRMALESFMPGYLAAQGRPENVEFIEKVSAAVDAKPELKIEIEKLALRALRTRKAA